MIRDGSKKVELRAYDLPSDVIGSTMAIISSEDKQDGASSASALGTGSRIEAGHHAARIVSSCQLAMLRLGLPTPQSD